MTMIDEAISRAGGAGPLSKKLGVTRQAVHSWSNRGWFPVPRALEVAKLTDVPARHLIDPELLAALMDE